MLRAVWHRAARGAEHQLHHFVQAKLERPTPKDEGPAPEWGRPGERLGERPCGG